MFNINIRLDPLYTLNVRQNPSFGTRDYDDLSRREPSFFFFFFFCRCMKRNTCQSLVPSVHILCQLILVHHSGTQLKKTILALLWDRRSIKHIRGKIDN